MEPLAEGWVWLSTPELDFGSPTPARRGETRVVWLHADPYGALGLPRSAAPEEVQRAVRTLSRRYHPDVTGDDPVALERFLELQRAASATRALPDLSLEPLEGDWWRLTGFVRPEEDPDHGWDAALVGLSFSLTELQRVPRDGDPDQVRISVGGDAVSLALSYSGARSARPVRLARRVAAAEPVALVILCLALVPLFSFGAALVTYLLSHQDVAATWSVGLVLLAGGYALLGLATMAGDSPVAYPRRAVFRARSTIGEIGRLARGRPL